MIKQIISALLLGIIASIVFLQRDPVVKRAVGLYCADVFQHALACTMSMRVKSINLFTGTLTFEDVTAEPYTTKDWSWHSKTLTLTFTFWELLPSKKIAMHMQFDTIRGKTTIEKGTFGIVPHIIQVMQGFSPDIPIILRSVTFLHAQLDGSDGQGIIDGSLCWNSILKFTDDSFKAAFHCLDGNLSLYHKRCFDMVDGSITIDMPYSKEYWEVNTDLRCHVPQLAQPGLNCFCAGNVRSGRGSFTVRSIDDSLTVNPITIDLRSHTAISAVIRAPLNSLLAIVMQQKPNAKIGGHGILNVAYVSDAQEPLSGTLTCSQCAYNGVQYAADSTITFAQRDNRWQGKLAWHYADWLGIHGAWTWDTSAKKGSIQGSNDVPLKFFLWPQWQIATDACSLSCTFDSQYRLQGTYKAVAKNDKTEKKLQLSGTVVVDEHDIALRGKLDEQNYNLVFRWWPMFGIKEFNIATSAGEQHVNVKGRGPDFKRIVGTVNFQSLSTLIRDSTTVALTGEGVVDVYGVIDYPRLAIKTHFSQGAIRLPQTYNCINELVAVGTIDLENRKARVRSLYCKLYEGALQSTKAHIAFNEQWQPTFVYIPLLFDHCLLNMKKDLFATISGDLLFSKHESEMSRVAGHVVLNRSHVADNIFSGAFHETISQFTKQTLSPHGVDMLCDLSIETQHPIHIKTSFFDTQATAALQVNGSMYAPHVSGTVALDGGSLLFPYKQLQITKGTLMMNEQQLDDPFIEIVAKNKIKKYLVSLNVQGSLKHCRDINGESGSRLPGKRESLSNWGMLSSVVLGGLSPGRLRSFVGNAVPLPYDRRVP